MSRRVGTDRAVASALTRTADAVDRRPIASAADRLDAALLREHAAELRHPQPDTETPQDDERPTGRWFEVRHPYAGLSPNANAPRMPHLSAKGMAGAALDDHVIAGRVKR